MSEGTQGKPHNRFAKAALLATGVGIAAFGGAAGVRTIQKRIDAEGKRKAVAAFIEGIDKKDTKAILAALEGHDFKALSESFDGMDSYYKRREKQEQAQKAWNVILQDESLSPQEQINIIHQLLEKGVYVGDERHHIRETLLELSDNANQDIIDRAFVIAARLSGNQLDKVIVRLAPKATQAAKDEALLLAATSPDNVKFLLEAGSQPDAYKDKDGNTALFEAVAETYYNESIELLLSAGSNPHLKNRKGQDAFMLADENIEHVRRTPIQAGGPPNSKGEHSLTAMDLLRRQEYIQWLKEKKTILTKSARSNHTFIEAEQGRRTNNQDGPGLPDK